MKHRLTVACLLAATAAVGLFVRAPGGEGPGRRPSFLVIRADELRASALGCYGDRRARTPHIDGLAARGVRFARAIVSEPSCASYRTSFDTGLYTFANPNRDKLHPDDETIHGLLRAAGYYTFHVGKWHKTPAYLRGPDDEVVPEAILGGLDYHAGHEQQHLLVGPPRENQPSVYYENGHSAEHSAEPWRPQKHVDLAKERLDHVARRGIAFYGVIDLEPPHFPYPPIRDTRWNVFDAGDIPAPGNVPAEALEQVQKHLAYYYSMVHSVDDMVGQLLAHLATLELEDSTVVIFTSDHGAHLGAHGLVDNEIQKRSPYEEAIKVPLIIRDPREPAGRIDDTLFSTVDFKPLILSRAGIPPSPELHGLRHVPQGRLLLQLRSEWTPDGVWYGFVRDDGWKYARSEKSGAWLLFDTSADPLELHNLVDTGHPEQARMGELLLEAARAVGFTPPF